MSWAVEDWAAGLPGRAQQKVRELQNQHERLQREKQQKQLQLDSTETALGKQKQKFEELRSELVGVRRDLQSSQEEVQAGVRARERLSQELQVKQAQLCGLEGQLDGARSLSLSLTQEVKRLEAELEKLQNTSSSGDSTPFSTPCWNMSSSWENSGSRREGKDRSGSDAEVKALHVRQLQFADRGPNPVPSPFSRQAQSIPPSHRPNWQADSSTPSVFPWERGDTSSTPKGRPVSLVSPVGDVIDRRGLERCEEEAGVRKENDVQRSKILELQTWVQSLEQEVRSASDQHRESEARLVEVRRELAAREENLSRVREQLERANSGVEKEKDRAQAVEQRVKQLQEELSCQRQNAESSRHSAEQRRKDLEKEHQRELLELQKESQSSEKQHQQESSRLNQDLQQARTLHNTLQAQCDKVLLQKQAVEKDLDSVRGKLQWTEKELQEGQRREVQVQGKLTEALQERDSLGLSLEQSSQRLKTLEEEVKRLTQELAEALKSLSEMQAQLAEPATLTVPARFTPAGDAFSCSATPHHERPHFPTRVQKKKAARPDRSRQEEQEQRAKYPKDREPGEGIDADFIGEFGSGAPENPKGEGGRERSEEDMRGSVTAEEEEEKGGMETCLVKRNQTCIHEVSVPMKDQKDAGADQGSTMPREVSMLTKEEKQGDDNSDGDTQTKSVAIESQGSSISSTGAKGQRNSPSLQDLNRENATLRDDLREAKRQLELRLEDLETQRRAEAEARAKLKQVSRKHSSQAEKLRQKTQELREEGGQLERALEEERAESGRLREALAALEMERREERIKKEREEEERAKSANLRADLAKLESELRKEQEEREREKQERELERLKDEEGRRALTERLAELQLSSKREGRNGNEEGEKPVTPQTLECSTNQNSNNNNIASVKDDGVILSPGERISLSDSVNQGKTKTLEKGEIYLITKERTKASKPPVESRGADLGKPGDSEVQAKPEKALDSDETALLVLEVERLRRTCETLRGERNREAGKAKQTHARLEVLQSQVTNQTKQLTLAFENQSSHIEDLLRELQDRDSALQRLEEELQDCRAKIAEQKAEKLVLTVGNEGLGKPEKAELKELNSEKAPTPVQRVTADIEAEQTAGKGTRQESGPTTLSMTLGINNDGSVRDLEAELRDLKAENEDLRSKFTAAVLLKELSCIRTEPIAVSGDGTNQRQVAELPSVEREPRQPRTDNEELKSSLSRVESPNKQENHPVDSEVKQGPVCDSQQHNISSGNFGTEATQPKGGEEALARRESLSELRENEELKSNLDTAPSFTGIMLQTASTGQKGNAGSTSSKRLESDTDAQHHQNTTLTLQAENQALRCWALSLCPPDRLGELAAITEGGLRQGTRCELSARYNNSAAGRELNEDKPAESERVAIREQSSPSDGAAQWLPKSTPAREPTSHQGKDETNLERGKDRMDPIQAEPCSVKSREMDGAAQQLGFTGDAGREKRFSPSRITALQKQLVELQSQVSSLREENARQAEELEVWRVTGEPVPPLLVGETTIHPHVGSITVVREDQLLLTCRASKLVGSMPTVGDVQVGSVGRDAFERLTAPAERGTNEDGKSPGRLKPAGRTSEPLRGTGRLQMTKVLVTDGDILIDLKTNATAHKEMDEGTKTRKNRDNNVSHPGSATMEGAENSKEIHCWVAGKQTKEIGGAHRDNQQKDSHYHDSKSKAAGCRITEDCIKAAYCEDSQAKTEYKAKAIDYRGNRAIPVESALMQIDRGPLMEGAGAVKRIRRNRNRMSAAFDDTEYEPYGLPEVVMMGFADIPSGPACPYVLRRGLLGTSALPLPLREHAEGERDDSSSDTQC
ncbi:hypothetical protein AAFF_G00321340 [Aldrovandia affinis]|uniref:Centromere protein F-like n=1 Tax=Aldrovandia affinis TaxID=143900 RepID=A0AAD7SMB7_9TELE|nr:hypothetical protein AAFF_G00321340 [Aldrovandia affinis]